VTRVVRDVVGLFESSAREGRIARARGTARELNPHGTPEEAHQRLWAPTMQMKLHAWWQGWDQTDHELGDSYR
jgi:hypothetical protein